jgi:hypothetical protein
LPNGDDKIRFLHWFYANIKPVENFSKEFVYSYFVRNDGHKKRHSGLYFIRKGSVNMVTNRQLHEFASLGKGSVFGLEDFLLNLPEADLHGLNDGLVGFAEYNHFSFTQLTRRRFTVKPVGQPVFFKLSLYVHLHTL